MRSCTGPTVESSESAQRAEALRRSEKPTRWRIYDEAREKIRNDPKTGKVPDAVGAAKYGVSERWYREFRQSLGIGPAKNPALNWTDEMIEDLKSWKKTRREFGEKWCMTITRINYQKKKLGLCKGGKFQDGNRQRDEDAPIFPGLHYPRSEELRDAIREIKRVEVAERLALNWDVAAHARILHKRYYFWSACLRRAPIHSDGSYRGWIRNMLGHRVDLLGPQ